MIQEVIALIRPTSIRKPSTTRLEDKGLQIRRCDLKDTEEHLIEALTDIDVVVSCVGPTEQQDQIHLAGAAKKTRVKRFIPCGFITVCPPGGIMWLRDEVSGMWCRGALASKVTVLASHRKKSSTTRSASSGSLTLLSISAGGTSWLTLALSPAASTMP